MLYVNQPVIIGSVRAELTMPHILLLQGMLKDDVTQRVLAHHLRDLHVHLVASKTESFIVDVRGLQFVNSSALRLFVDLASRADPYKLIFKIDTSITWHRLSFSVLQSLAPNRVELRDGLQ
jgi:hypothetical protein